MTADVYSGLGSKEAARRRQIYGPNVLPGKKPPGFFLIFLRQFRSTFIYVLFVAALVSYFLGHVVNSYFVLAVLFLNAIIGTIQEFSAEKAATSLKKMVPTFAMVIRDGKPCRLNSEDLVPGDIVMLAPGDKVPADVKLLESRELHVDESMLTGESMAAHKRLTRGMDVFCYAGTSIMRGRARAEVVAIGAETEIGHIATAIDIEAVKPPLLQRIERFTLMVTYAILLLITLIFLITLVRGDELGTVFLLGVALAVSAIPEGLPAAITVALAIGMRRMAKNKVIIRKLLAVESLGSCTHIASDKTGTLTVNEMTIRRVLLSDGSHYQVSGEGLDLHGQMIADDNASPDLLHTLNSAGILANEATIQGSGDQPFNGDMVDMAFLVLAGKNNIECQALRRQCPEVASIPYESELGYAASVNRVRGRYQVHVKGSVEKVLAMCDGSADETSAFIPEEFLRQAVLLAGQGYRVLGVAVRQLDQEPDEIDDVICQMTFVGMVGIIDPLRPEIKDSIDHCRQASINVSMITGDHPQTAMALALEAGIAQPGMKPVTGDDLDQAAKAGNGALARLVARSRVFARVAPTQKKQIVEELINSGEIVAVTGDGVNDAPALSHAHVGISMGLRGTDVARENSELILTDDHFASIVLGIKQGRIVYNNIRKVIFLLISTGAAEVILVMLSLLFGTSLPLFPIQLLWLNLVTNGIQDVALAFEPEEGNELRQRPRPPGESIFNRLMVERVLVNAIFMGCVAFVVFVMQLNSGATEFEARNITLLLMVLFENVHVLNSRSERISIFRQYFFGNKFLILGMIGAQFIHIGSMYTPGIKMILQIAPVSIEQWFRLLGVALILIIVNELHKFLTAERTAIKF